MVQLVDGQFFIEDDDFMNLIDSGNWSISVGMKDNWCAQRHLEYILGLINTKTNQKVDFIIDNNNLNQARQIDVYITSNRQYTDAKHIQFIKTKNDKE